MRRSREATFERIIQNAPAAFSPAQLRVLLRAIVNLDPYTFADDLAQEISGDNESEQRSAEEVLLSAIDGLTDDKLSAFAVRLVFAGYRSIPRESEFDFLTEAESVFAPQPTKKPKPSKAKEPAPIKTDSKPVKKAVIKKPKEPQKAIEA